MRGSTWCAANLQLKNKQTRKCPASNQEKSADVPTGEQLRAVEDSLQDHYVFYGRYGGKVEGYARGGLSR